MLYIRPDPLQIRAPANVPPEVELARRVRAETVAEFLRSLPPQERTEAARREALELLADLPAVLRPDTSGRFAGEAGHASGDAGR